MTTRWQVPQGVATTKGQEKQKILVLAGGRAPRSEWLRQLEPCTAVYAADKGLESCLKAQLRITQAYGDFDSVSDDALSKALEQHIPLVRYPRAKDSTDLQLVLEELPAQAQVIVSGIWGGRWDHLWANIYSLWHYKKARQAQVVLADDKELMFLLEAGETLSWQVGQPVQALSLLPLTVQTEVTLAGVRWPLSQALLEQEHTYAISNEVTDSCVRAVCHSGAVGVYFHFEGLV